MRELVWICTMLMATFVAITPVYGEGAAAGTSTAPSQLSETYEDWSVACIERDGSKRCLLSQRQFHKNGQHVLTLELRPAENAGLEGSLALPFGLHLDKGVTLGVDEATGGKPARFRTCLPFGCVVPLAFTAATVELLRNGQALKIGAFASDTDKEVQFSVSLKGFAAAFDRVLALNEKS
ncbi:MAG TPA: invasion associated locus B family protein [Ensifer sp.]|jgi:invasion protein IalB|uniref:invasion associated locus B family protein n=1 Tax=Ensifer sp. TaxID=1872086 RepID=UPI002E0F323B|nr:invasion associated locus B family protein [Ensifer sp.]